MWDSHLAWGARMACRSSRKDCAGIHSVPACSIARALATNALQADFHPTFMPSQGMRNCPRESARCGFDLGTSTITFMIPAALTTTIFH
jgi:hypothetical protein